MRALLAVLLLTPALAVADPSVPADVPADAVAEPAVPAPSSALDSVRLFNTTEAFHLEPHDVRTEVRIASGIPGTDPTMEVRAEVGLTQHFQLNLAEDIADPAGGSLKLSSTPIGLRYSLGTVEDFVFLNPAIEATLTPRANAPARAGLRLLLAEELVTHLVVAANGYIEQNLNRETSPGVDGTLGMTGGISYAFLNGRIHVGAEGQVGEAQYGTLDYHAVIAAGPNAVATVGKCAATLSSMFNLVPRQVGIQPMATVGCTF